MASDHIIIKELELRVRIGCTPEERTFPQRLVLDVEVALDTREAARTGQLERTVCYAQVTDLIRRLVDQQSWPLIEQLGEDVVRTVHENFPPAVSTLVRIRKFVLPGTAWVGLELVRSRSELEAS